MYWWHGGFHEPEPGVKLEWPLLKRVFSYFLPYWRLALVVLACIGAAAALGLIPALVTRDLINYLSGQHGGFGFVALLIAILVGSSLLGGLIGVLQSYVSNRISQSIMFDLRNQLFDRVLKQSIAFFTATRTGDVMSRLSNDVNGVQSVVSDTIFSLVNNVVILASTVVLMFALDWKLTIATVLLGRLYGPVGSLANLQVNVVGSLALFQRIFEYMDLPVVIDQKPEAVHLDQARGQVEFDQVTFRYGSSDRPALTDVSFRIEPGQLAALVGPTGAGKTTVTNLLPRFYDPQLGSVRLDGHDVRDLTLESLGRQVGMVFQDTFLFHASIRENLLYARPDATEAEMVAAAKAAYIHDFIESLPDAYDTVVGERGHRLSGGEKQRVAIARVILKDPRVLILDEATSNLDSESEHLIQVALRPLFRGRTSLVIAHRLSTILAADVILVMDHGEVVEQGRHADLLEQGGLYARLYQRQFEPADELATTA